MLTAHDAYIKHRESLFSAITEFDIQFHSQETIRNYLENRAIWDELNYYEKHNKILGKHRIFYWMKRLNTIRSMNIGDLVRLKMRLENNIIKNRAKWKRDPKHPETANRIERIKEMRKELDQVNQLLNL